MEETKEQKELRLLKTEARELKKQIQKPNLQKIQEKHLLKEINKRGFMTIKKEISQDVEYDFPEETGSFQIGVVSDTHLGSCYQQLTFLKHFYKECQKLGITKILHAGDMIEGNGKLYRGQMYEMFLHGASNQLRYIIKNYPKYEGVETYVIGGSHDYSFYKESGYDILEEISKKRKDIKYLGMFGAYLNIGQLKFYLMHGSGGVAYARSYKLQKIIEQLAPEAKPHILLLGHYHTPCHLPMYRNVEGFQLGCFQSQTPYLRSKAQYPAIGGIILTVHQDEKGLQKIDICWKYYYEVIEHDY